MSTDWYNSVNQTITITLIKFYGYKFERAPHVLNFFRVHPLGLYEKSSCAVEVEEHGTIPWLIYHPRQEETLCWDIAGLLVRVRTSDTYTDFGENIPAVVERVLPADTLKVATFILPSSVREMQRQRLTRVPLQAILISCHLTKWKIFSWNNSYFRRYKIFL